MTINLVIAGATLPYPSSAADTDWAAQQVAAMQALAAGVNSIAALQAAVVALQALVPIQRLFQSAQAVSSTADNNEDTLMTYTLPANALATANKGLRVTGWGTGANSATAIQVRAYFGATRVVNQTLTLNSNNTWQIVYQTGAVAPSSQNTTALFNGSPGTVQTITPTTEDTSQPIIIRFTGQKAPAGTLAGAVIQTGMLVELLP